MKVTVIGRCGTYPVPGQATAGYLLETEEGRILIDCGSAVVEKLQSLARLEDVPAVMVSHYHHDHVADLGVLQYASLLAMQRQTRSRPLQAYLPAEPADDFRRYVFRPWCEAHPIREGDVLELYGMTIRFHRTVHPVPCLAMRFERQGRTLCYSADTSYHDGLIPFARGADLFICECNFFRDQDGTAAGHLNTLEAGKVAQEAGVPRLVLTHLPNGADHERLLAEVRTVYEGEVQLAEFGLSVEV
ncbi:MAG: MBL fold metallo-hydrolase [Alicyclobacillus sp.]|nr:MBL fold metallo-hydrolase [Alicyclobacillus sp.]